MKITQITNLYIATLRAIYLVEQNAHWTVKGTGFYGDHLLFQRLYESAVENADLAAEKFIGVFGSEALDYGEQCKLIAGVMEKYTHLKDDPAKQCLALEKDFLTFAEKAFKAIEDEDMMTLGVDDAFTAISDARESACYLLQQTLEKTAQYKQKMKLAQMQAKPNENLGSYLDTALKAAIINIGNISSSFHGELQSGVGGTANYIMYFSPPLNVSQKQQILHGLNAYIAANRPQLKGHVSFKFDQ